MEWVETNHVKKPGAYNGGVSIDDPFDALKGQFDAEERARDPVAARLAELASIVLPPALGRFAQLLVSQLGADRLSKIELTLTVIMDEIRRHERRIEEMRVDQEKFEAQCEEWFALVRDGAERAQRMRATERIERIGRILVNTFVAPVFPLADDVEELMRTAMELSESDVKLLCELVRIQGGLLAGTGTVARYSAWESWTHGNWNIAPAGELESAFSKLESFGLVTRIAPPNNLNIMADFQNRYSLLKKGLDFVNFARG